MTGYPAFFFTHARTHAHAHTHTHTHTRSYPTALKMVSSGQVNVKPLITHSYELRDSVKVIKYEKNQQKSFLKVNVAEYDAHIYTKSTTTQ